MPETKAVTTFTKEDEENLQKASEYAEKRDFLNLRLTLDKFLVRHPFHEDVLKDRAATWATGEEFKRAYKDIAYILASGGWQKPELHNIAALYASSYGDYKLSLYHLDEALRLNPHMRMIRWNRALLLITLGQWEEGWKEYNWRTGTVTRNPTKLQWDGSYLGPDKTLYLWWEQGYGDTLNMLRFIPQVKKQSGARLVIEVQHPIVPLLHDLIGTSGVQIVAPCGYNSFVCDYDEHIPFMSLPGVCGLKSPSEVPNGLWAKFAPDPKILEWAKGRKVVGICWKGSKDHPADQHRSIPPKIIEAFVKCLPEELAILSLVPGEKVPGACPGDSACGECEGEDICPRFGTFESAHFGQTAQVLAACDVIVSVDTAVAHLAGITGRPVELLLSYANDYRWMSKGVHFGHTKGNEAGTLGLYFDSATATPWYEETSLFRQESFGKWWGPLDSVRIRIEYALTGYHVNEVGRVSKFTSPEWEAIKEGEAEGLDYWTLSFKVKEKDDKTDDSGDYDSNLTAYKAKGYGFDEQVPLPSHSFNEAVAQMDGLGGPLLYSTYHFIARMLNAKVIVETGIYSGASTCYLALAAKITGGHVYAFDDYSMDATAGERAKEHFKATGLDEYITVIEGDAIESLKDFILLNGYKPQYDTSFTQRLSLSPFIDLVVLDDDHSTAHVLHELNILYWFLKPGGMILSHDGNNLSCPGVQIAFWEFAFQKKLQVITLFAANGICAIQKPLMMDVGWSMVHAQWLPKKIEFDNGDPDYEHLLKSGLSEDGERQYMIRLVNEANGFKKEVAEVAE